MQLKSLTYFFEDDSKIELKDAIILVLVLYVSLSKEEFFLHYFTPNFGSKKNKNSEETIQLGATSLAFITAALEDLLQVEEILVTNSVSEIIDKASFALFAEDGSILEVRSNNAEFLCVVSEVMNSLEIKCVEKEV